MNVIGIMALIFLLSFLVESLVEAAFGGWLGLIERLESYRAMILLYIAFAAGVLGAWVYRFDLVQIASVWLKAEVPCTPFGITLTGLAIGRGSHFIHDIFKRFIAQSPLEEPPMPDPVVEQRIAVITKRSAQ